MCIFKNVAITIQPLVQKPVLKKSREKRKTALTSSSAGVRARSPPSDEAAPTSVRTTEGARLRSRRESEERAQTSQPHFTAEERKLTIRSTSEGGAPHKVAYFLLFWIQKKSWKKFGVWQTCKSKIHVMVIMNKNKMGRGRSIMNRMSFSSVLWLKPIQPS